MAMNLNFPENMYCLIVTEKKSKWEILYWIEHNALIFENSNAKCNKLQAKELSPRTIETVSRSPMCDRMLWIQTRLD